MTQRVYYDDGTPRGPGGTPRTSTSTTPAPKSPTATPSAASTGSPASPPAEPSEDTSPTPTGTGSPTRPCPSTSGGGGVNSRKPALCRGRARRAGGHTDSLREVSASRSRRRTCSLVYPRVSAMSVCLTPRARRVPMTRPRSSRACRTAASAWLIRVTAARSSVMSVSFMGSVSHSVMWPILGMPHEDRQHELWPHAMWRMVGPARGTSPAPSRQGGAP